jgi:D-glycero-D-manno-heptose 1,7-bisphosphate phosphatase
MALKAKDKYPEIDFSKAIMVGDKSADMEWGRNIGARTVWITSKRYEDTVRGETIDVTCDSLSDLVHSLRLQK